MAATRDQVVAVVGALAIALTLSALLVVEARTGPFHHRIDPATVPAALTGTYRAEQADTTQGMVCDATDAPGCPDERVEIEIVVEGLAQLEGAGHYAAFLTGPDRRVQLGVLEHRGDGHRLSVARAIDLDGLDAITLALVPTPSTGEPSPFVLHELPIPASSGEPVELSRTFDANPVDPGGTLDVAQVGVVEVSTTAKARIGALQVDEAWRYRAWLIAGDGTATLLGTLGPEGETTRTLDVRVGQVALADQERFQVRLVPADGASDRRLGGFPVVDAPLDASTLLG